jgi:hypothetical protein
VPALAADVLAAIDRIAPAQRKEHAEA